MMKNREQTLQAIEKFILVVEELRGENGCPWDKAQTHGSLRMQLIEEAYEAAEAMKSYEDKKETENLKEELGDILLHIIMHGVIAEEEEIFSIEDMVTGITEKMIHRHPHVFSKEEWEKQDRKKTWEELKAEEAGHAKEKILPLHSVPKALPALLRMCKVLKKADAAYQKRTSREESLEEISKLVTGLKNVENREEEEKTISSMLYHLCNLSWQDKINPEELLIGEIEKIISDLE